MIMSEIVLTTDKVIKKDFRNMSYKEFKNKYMSNGGLTPEKLLNIFQENCKDKYSLIAKKSINSNKKELVKEIQKKIDAKFDGVRIYRTCYFDVVQYDASKNGRLDVSELDAQVKYKHQSECYDKREKANKSVFISDKELDNLKMSQVIDYMLELLVPYENYSKEKHGIILNA